MFVFLLVKLPWWCKFDGGADFEHIENIAISVCFDSFPKCYGVVSLYYYKNVLIFCRFSDFK